MQITIPKSAEAGLRAQAKASGFASVDDYVFSQLQLGSDVASHIQSYEDWRRELDAYLNLLTPGVASFDDSRDSIYPDR